MFVLRGIVEFMRIDLLFSKANVTFSGDIQEKATLTIDGRKHTNVTFPYTTKIRRGFDETIVKIEAPNHTAEPIIINL